jgi:hypothetical protein
MSSNPLMPVADFGSEPWMDGAANFPSADVLDLKRRELNLRKSQKRFAAKVWSTAFRLPKCPISSSLSLSR